MARIELASDISKQVFEIASQPVKEDFDLVSRIPRPGKQLVQPSAISQFDPLGPFVPLCPLGLCEETAGAGYGNVSGFTRTPVVTFKGYFPPLA